MPLPSLKQDERFNAIYNPNLVFYADLSKHDGLTFRSDDAYGHLCTATGTTWGPQGRTFNGVDDKIRSVAFTSPLSPPYTIIVWAKATGTGCIFDGLTENEANFYFESFPTTVDFQFYNGSYQLITDNVTSLWHMYSVVVNGASSFLAIDIDKKVSANLSATALTGVSLGQTGAGSRVYSGTEGDVFVYSGAFTLDQLGRIHQVTKWRYQ